MKNMSSVKTGNLSIGFTRKNRLLSFKKRLSPLRESLKKMAYYD